MWLTTAGSSKSPPVAKNTEEKKPLDWSYIHNPHNISSRPLTMKVGDHVEHFVDGADAKTERE
jgi:hypothetical protein